MTFDTFRNYKKEHFDLLLNNNLSGDSSLALLKLSRAVGQAINLPNENCLNYITSNATKNANVLLVITSKCSTVTVANQDGTSRDVEVRVWNDTIANLTLMALG